MEKHYCPTQKKQTKSFIGPTKKNNPLIKRQLVVFSNKKESEWARMAISVFLPVFYQKSLL